MPHATNAGNEIRYEVDAPDTGDGDEAVVFCGDVGLGAWQFGWQHAALAGPHTVITPETRGVGRSDAPPGPYAVGELAADVDAVCAAEGIRNAHLVGYGLGGMVALTAAASSSRPASVALVGTPPAGDAYNPDGVWAPPADPAAVEGSLNGLLSLDFREAHPDALSRIAEWRLAEDADRETYEAHRAAIEGFDLTGRLHEITTPALVVHGTDDTVCPATAVETLAEGLPRGELHGIDGARHLVGVEASAAVNDLLVGWLAEHAAGRFE
ncbi:alpha/beta hydrolase [Halorubrum ezzemoulense]|uniref:Alpha/beta hydrolase n=1 Tax=Halorubrum ezzemoulense TaxID=337243 RepID=A0ABT4Z3V8_HALEZ|nr:alpha/beta hydrolase [Halorubrum ezzemoulense]MDB2244750.1 alpha/beta hydrolase [Halorubrum ezzemoulense]MDB2250957.1 alpha/beta hydrolase [Halorubrum ezzemoulense]MDB2278493.1 alpha/beta hydrolase [Halorubrum ezzemoulense]MDB2285167.1 alpha/beta hydrolase [Halorubrum ezzemoulense]MDB2288084.1 alpha/beta hydrolase [Halorubrum ezzemoulense]